MLAKQPMHYCPYLHKEKAFDTSLPIYIGSKHDLRPAFLHKSFEFNFNNFKRVTTNGLYLDDISPLSTNKQPSSPNLLVLWRSIYGRCGRYIHWEQRKGLYKGVDIFLETWEITDPVIIHHATAFFAFRYVLKIPQGMFNWKVGRVMIKIEKDLFNVLYII